MLNTRKKPQLQKTVVNFHLFPETSPVSLEGRDDFFMTLLRGTHRSKEKDLLTEHRSPTTTVSNRWNSCSEHYVLLMTHRTPRTTTSLPWKACPLRDRCPSRSLTIGGSDWKGRPPSLDEPKITLVINEL